MIGRHHQQHGPTWRVGEVAKATGQTVRTLHYYNEIGLLQPSMRLAQSLARRGI
jgi:MerR family transcriptional regulator, thiopeptide resistance regulator